MIVVVIAFFFASNTTHLGCPIKGRVMQLDCWYPRYFSPKPSSRCWENRKLSTLCRTLPVELACCPSRKKIAGECGLGI